MAGKMFTKVLVTLAFIVGIVGGAQAAPILDFGTGTAGPGGFIVCNGSTCVGSGIPTDTINALNTPISHPVTDTQGTFVSGTAVGGNSAVLAFSTSANTISIVGGVSAAGVPLGTNLLSGTLTSFTCTTQSGGSIINCSGSGTDTKDSTLLAYYGIPSNTPFNLFGFSLGGLLDACPTGVTAGSTCYQVTSTDITNTGGKIPEPASMLLFGFGLVGLGVWGRKRLSK